MPRSARKKSGVGIYHVMMRGINHQNIFEDEEDCWQFINTLDRMRVRYNDDGKPCGKWMSLTCPRGTLTLITYPEAPPNNFYNNLKNVPYSTKLLFCSKKSCTFAIDKGLIL